MLHGRVSPGGRQDPGLRFLYTSGAEPASAAATNATPASTTPSESTGFPADQGNARSTRGPAACHPGIHRGGQRWRRRYQLPAPFPRILRRGVLASPGGLEWRRGGGGAGGQGLLAEAHWAGAAANLGEMEGALAQLEKVLEGAVYLQEASYAGVASAARHGRTLQEQEKLIKSLESELAEAVAAAAEAHEQKRAAEMETRRMAARVADLAKELENTSHVFKLHVEELTSMQAALRKKDEEISELQTIIDAIRSD
eukprot:jgi/Mesvir1/29057/Mv18365-RA.1